MNDTSSFKVEYIVKVVEGESERINSVYPSLAEATEQSKSVLKNCKWIDDVRIYSRTTITSVKEEIVEETFSLKSKLGSE